MEIFLGSCFSHENTGQARANNVQSVLTKNLIDICIGTLAWWACGFAFAWAGSEDRFIGGKGYFFGADFTTEAATGRSALGYGERIHEW